MSRLGACKSSAPDLQKQVQSSHGVPDSGQDHQGDCSLSIPPSTHADLELPAAKNTPASILTAEHSNLPGQNVSSPTPVPNVIPTAKVAENVNSFRNLNDIPVSSTGKTVAAVGHENVNDIGTEGPGKCFTQLECLAGSSIVENAEVKSLKEVISTKNSEILLLKENTQALEEVKGNLKRECAAQLLELAMKMNNTSAKDAQLKFLKSDVKVKKNDIAHLLSCKQNLQHSVLELKRKLEELRHLTVNMNEKDEQIKSLKDLINVKDNDIALLEKNTQLLKEANVKLGQKVEKIQQQLCKDRANMDGSYVDGSQTPFLLESAAKDMFSSIATFTSLFSKYMPRNGYSPARHFLQNRLNLLNITYPYMTRDHHWILLLKSVICEHLFNNFETEMFIPYSTRNDNNVLFLDNEERVRNCFRYFQGSSSSIHETSTTNNCHWWYNNFLQYWESALQILPKEFHSLIEYFQFTIHGEPRANLRDMDAQADVLKSFIIAAKKVWDFHKLCLSFDSPARIFRVAVGHPLNEEYMESAVTLEDDDRFVPKVGFMIYPGFRLRKTVIKAEVYHGVN